MAKATNVIENTQVELHNVTLDLIEKFDFQHAEKILQLQESYDNKPFVLPKGSPFVFIDNKLQKPQ